MPLILSMSSELWFYYLEQVTIWTWHWARISFVHMYHTCCKLMHIYLPPTQPPTNIAIHQPTYIHAWHILYNKLLTSYNYKCCSSQWALVSYQFAFNGISRGNPIACVKLIPRGSPLWNMCHDILWGLRQVLMTSITQTCNFLLWSWPIKNPLCVTEIADQSIYDSTMRV